MYCQMRTGLLPRKQTTTTVRRHRFIPDIQSLSFTPITVISSYENHPQSRPSKLWYSPHCARESCTGLITFQYPDIQDHAERTIRIAKVSSGHKWLVTSNKQFYEAQAVKKKARANTNTNYIYTIFRHLVHSISSQWTSSDHLQVQIRYTDRSSSNQHAFQS